MRDLSGIVKAYDVRGLVPDELDEALVRELGRAFAALVAHQERATSIVIARDMRESGVALAAAFAEGVTSQGLDVVDVGLASTDMLYFASGKLGLPGAQFTASHNPARYNGIKLCYSQARPVGQDTGLAQVRDWVATGTTPDLAAQTSGTLREQDLLDAYGEFLVGLVDLRQSRPLRIVVDAGNGMAGYTVPGVFGPLPFEIIPMYFELDGSFPNHEANPIDPANLRDLQAKVRETGADLGLAFDGDADRCFPVDERGELVSPSAVTALVAVRELARDPGGTIIHNLISSRAVPEIVRESGGTPVRSRVGHSFIKALMAETGAVFGGEHSGHFYFRDFWRADSGMLAALHLLAALSETDQPLSSLLSAYNRYTASGEINTQVADTAAKINEIEARYAALPGVRTDRLDGLTVELPGGAWFNVRPSNTEPLLRLNVESADPAEMARIRDEVLAQMRS